MHRMKGFFYQHAGIILLCAGFLFGLACFSFDKWVDAHQYSTELSWSIVIAACTVYGGIIGKLIQRLNQGRCVDALTGLSNRHYFYLKLQEELERTGRTGNPTSLAILDVDNFKQINDTYGHLVGDRTLKQIAKILQQNVRGFDSVVRWGGEEFAIILSNADNNTAFLVAERIRKAVAEFAFECNVTVSIGVSSVTFNTDLENLVRNADNALYKAKKTKNKTVMVD